MRHLCLIARPHPDAHMTVFRNAVFHSLSVLGAITRSRKLHVWKVILSLWACVGSQECRGARFFGLDELQVVQGHGWGKSEGRNTVSIRISTHCIVQGMYHRLGQGMSRAVPSQVAAHNHTLPPGQSKQRIVSVVKCVFEAVAALQWRAEGHRGHRG